MSSLEERLLELEEEGYYDFLLIKRTNNND